MPGSELEYRDNPGKAGWLVGMACVQMEFETDLQLSLPVCFVYLSDCSLIMIALSDVIDRTQGGYPGHHHNLYHV